ncbi:MAG: hypothetical protein ABIO44_11220 [Saprospiraceae bacterium]
MIFEYCCEDDIEQIIKLYTVAIEFQKNISNQNWLDFDRSNIMVEIGNQLIWKIVRDNKIVGLFNILLNDEVIWGEKENNLSIYLHRIVAERSLPLKLMPLIISWAREYAQSIGRNFIRMDTWSDNPKLIEYYMNLGFKNLGSFQAANPNCVPANYSSISLALLELQINRH